GRPRGGPGGAPLGGDGRRGLRAAAREAPLGGPRAALARARLRRLAPAPRWGGPRPHLDRGVSVESGAGGWRGGGVVRMFFDRHRRPSTAAPARPLGGRGRRARRDLSGATARRRDRPPGVRRAGRRRGGPLDARL